MMMRGVQRTVAVFECFTPERLSLTLQEIADTMQMAKSTTFRIVQSLEQAGYLIRLDDQKYCLSFRFTRLAGMVMSTLSIRQVARPLMIELARQTNETITLNVASGRVRTCIDVIDTPSPLMSLARPGQQVPLDGKGATAKTLMAHQPQERLRKLLGPAAKSAGRKPADLMAELARIRRDGYSASDGQRVLGLSAIAAPVWESDDTANYCLTLTAPTVRMEPKMDEFVRLMLKTSSDISRRLGAATLPSTIASRAPRAKKSANGSRAQKRRRTSKAL
jgi:DNA-binding IclR family transcriptional regulator